MEPNNRVRHSAGRYARRQHGLRIAALLLGLIVALDAASLLSPDRDTSENENRKLAQFPSISWSSVKDGSYFSALESYASDQFVLRDFWITLKSKTDRLIGKRESNGVYLCKDDYLMEIPATPEKKTVDRTMQAVDRFAARHTDLKFYMTIVPNAVCVLSDKLPSNAPVRDQRKDLSGIAGALEGVTFLDVTDVLCANRTEQLYYRTDHHWTSRAACCAFKAMAPSMGLDADAAQYDIYTVSDTFEGTLASRSGVHDVKDTIEVYAPKTDVKYCVNYPDTKQTVCSLYVRDCLKDKDQYTVFFGGNHPRVDVTTTADTGKTLLLLKDSYANCFVQFLTPYYDHIILIDPRYYYDSVDTILSREGVTDVLFLYNTDTFLGDTALADVLDSGAAD
jgi:hypothetical protein